VGGSVVGSALGGPRGRRVAARAVARPPPEHVGFDVMSAQSNAGPDSGITPTMPDTAEAMLIRNTWVASKPSRWRCCSALSSGAPASTADPSASVPAGPWLTSKPLRRSLV